HRVDHLGAHRLRNSRKIRFRKTPQRRRIRDTIEKRTLLGGNCHGINL
ncbi:hypothetical protein GGQ91_005498, partial [Methylobacterium fujisawaense]|nr:hypothetical protein [Methylobacterium fujisawaense]